MKIQISERECLGVWNCLGLGTVWGGNEDVLLGQAEVWEVLKIEERFATKTPRTVGDLSTALEDFELSDGAVKVLVSVLAGNGQGAATGPWSAKALARIKAGQ